MADDFLRPIYLGFIRLHILYHAAKAPICGVEIMDELRHHGYEIGPGTLYPVLNKMEADGLLACAAQVVDGKRRKNLRATAAGRAALKQARTKLKELAAEVLNDHDPRHPRKHS